MFVFAQSGSGKSTFAARVRNRGITASDGDDIIGHHGGWDRPHLWYKDEVIAPVIHAEHNAWLLDRADANPDVVIFFNPDIELFMTHMSERFKRHRVVFVVLPLATVVERTERRNAAVRAGTSKHRLIDIDEETEASRDFYLEMAKKWHLTVYTSFDRMAASERLHVVGESL